MESHGILQAEYVQQGLQDLDFLSYVLWPSATQSLMFHSYIEKKLYHYL